MYKVSMNNEQITEVTSSVSAQIIAESYSKANNNTEIYIYQQIAYGLLTQYRFFAKYKNGKCIDALDKNLII